MDEANKYNSSESSHPEPDADDHQDELAYMYQQEEHAGMQQLFQDPHPHPLHHALAMSGFQRFGSASALPDLSFGGAAAVAVKTEQGQPSLSRSGILSFGALPPAARTLSFSGGEDWPAVAVEGVPPERRSRSHLSAQEHVAAERKRREKMQQQFVALATMVPDLTKTDKISILGSTIQYVKQLEEKVKTLEKQQSERRTTSEGFEGKGHASSTDSQQAPGPSGSTHGVGSSIPTVEASIHGDTVLLKICCERRSGVLVMIISELESLGLSILNTSVFPFSSSYFSINITAKIGEGFSTTVELVKNLTTALRGFS